MTKNCTTCGGRFTCHYAKTCIFPKKCKSYWNGEYADPIVEFVSYDGAYPSLCAGTLVLRIAGELVTFPKYCLMSGGCVPCEEDEVLTGEWLVAVPEKYSFCFDEIHKVVNENVPHGCCGGCL